MTILYGNGEWNTKGKRGWKSAPGVGFKRFIRAHHAGRLIEVDEFRTTAVLLLPFSLFLCFGCGGKDLLTQKAASSASLTFVPQLYFSYSTNIRALACRL